MKRLRIPIRVKFMLVFLVLVTAVVGLFTFSTARSFQEDKQAYINGLTSMVALGMAEEARSTLAGYRERLRLYTRLVLDETMGDPEREIATRTLFEEFPELVAVVVQSDGNAPAGAYNVSVLREAGLTRDDLLEFQQDHPLPRNAIEGDEEYVGATTLSERLPAFTMAFKTEKTENNEAALVSGVLLSRRLQQLVTRFSAYEQFLTDSEGRLLVHSSPRRIKKDASVSLPPEVRRVGGEFNASMTLEYVSDGTEMIGGFASVEFARIIAGAQIPRSAAYLASEQIVSKLIVVALILLVVAIVAGVIFARRITRPMERLSDATRTIAKGEFDIEVSVDSADEMGDLAGSFNQMTSELKSRDEELHTAHLQLVHSEKMAAFGQLGAGIAHEVKNPLTGILACAQLAVDDVDEGSRLHEDLALIEKETRRCKEIIDNLLRFARQEQTVMTVIDVTEVLESSVAIVNHQLELNEVHVERQLLDEVPKVYGNANQLQQVFINLLINAQQAMEGSPGSIRISSDLDGDGNLVMRFVDTGPGIPEEIREKLFEPFFTTKESGKGTGLGLSVSLGIIQDHEGKIEVASEPGQGTTFTITLPTLVEGSQPPPADVESLQPVSC